MRLCWAQAAAGGMHTPNSASQGASPNSSVKARSQTHLIENEPVQKPKDVAQLPLPWASLEWWWCGHQAGHDQWLTITTSSCTICPKCSPRLPVVLHAGSPFPQGDVAVLGLRCSREQQSHLTQSRVSPVHPSAADVRRVQTASRRGWILNNSPP